MNGDLCPVVGKPDGEQTVVAQSSDTLGLLKLNEGTILYMPTALPGMSTTEAPRVLQAQDQLIKGFPEVDTVFGKIGRANSPTDPAPLIMVETVVTLKRPRLADVKHP